jgi:hypothetical protein
MVNGTVDRLKAINNPRKDGCPRECHAAGGKQLRMAIMKTLSR